MNNLLAFKLAQPITAPPPAEDDQEWRGNDRAEAGCYCTTRGNMGHCRPRYEGSSMTCTDWGWGTLECWCVCC